jgi:DNA-binding NtrC family response regulator/pSer/pThr/pTyr-binding forkhead associated (FHA) protein
MALLHCKAISCTAFYRAGEIGIHYYVRNMMPRIQALSGALEGSVFFLNEDDLNIGRAARNHVRLDDPLVSLKHCSISFEENFCMVKDWASEHGTFVNEFSFPAKIVVHGDHIRVGRSVFVYLLHDEVDERLLKLTETERSWVYGNHPPDRAGAYEAAKATTLAALLRMNATINQLRSADEIQARVLDFIFQVMPAECAAILLAGHDEDRFISSTYRSAGSVNGEPFSFDEAVAARVLRGGILDREDKAIFCPMAAFDTKVGVIYVTMAKSGSEWFTGAHMQLLESVAASTALALEHARYVAWLEGENRRLNEFLYAEHDMIGDSEPMKQIYRIIRRVGPGERPVLIIGPSGTGKEHVAYAIHRNSPRANKRYFVVNCGAFSESLLQSELFGHEKGAFTGAVALRKGLFEEADGCTVFLDEIGELPLNMQADLLRVLQQGEVKRLGGNAVIKVNVRIVAATNRNLREEVKKGTFREDLFYRLNVLPLQIPALAERREDIPLLAAHFIRKYRHLRCEPDPEVLGITPEAHQLLAEYGWPGNVRELENAIEWAISMGDTSYILPKDLPQEVQRSSDAGDSGEGSWYQREFIAFQQSLFGTALRQAGGNQSEAARRLGLHPTTFRRRCGELDVK